MYRQSVGIRSAEVCVVQQQRINLQCCEANIVSKSDRARLRHSIQDTAAPVAQCNRDRPPTRPFTHCTALAPPSLSGDIVRRLTASHWGLV